MRKCKRLALVSSPFRIPAVFDSTVQLRLSNGVFKVHEDNYGGHVTPNLPTRAHTTTPEMRFQLFSRTP